MKYLTILCCVIITIALVQAQDTCKISGGKIIRLGETFQKDGECALHTCVGQGEISGSTCSETEVINPEAYDYHPQDNTKPWPECCPKYVEKMII